MDRNLLVKSPRPTTSPGLVMRVALLLAIASFPAFAAETQAIFYVTGEDTRYELQIFHPRRATRTILEVPGEPSNIYWTDDFQTITFRVGEEVFESEWRIGSAATKVVTVPSVSDENYRQITVWYDPGSRAWRYYEIQYPAEDASEWSYFARVFQYDPDAKQWQKLVDRETYGCEQGDGSTCGAEVHQYTVSQGRHVFLTQLAEEMRLLSLMDARGIEYEESMEARDLWFDLGGKQVSVVPMFGDSLHAMAPVKWRGGSEARVIFPDGLGYPCMDQVGLKQVGQFLLVATEWYGRCGRVIDLESGETVHELPANAKNAVLVPWPERE